MDKGSYGRRDRLVKEKRHDPYKEREKWPEPTVCTQCGAVFTGGRWTWQEAPEKANKALCPACQRIRDKLPAGTIELTGKFLSTHKQEIMNLIKNEEKAEKQAHPMERIMEISEEEGGMTITTTGVHVARRIGEAIHRAYQGEFDFTYGDADKTIQVSWHRD
jgi:NMD protein affecting ribosome stability and mRNA decay